MLWPATTTVAEATAAVRAGLAFPNDLDAGSIAVAEQAGCLRELARMESAHTSAQARILAAFSGKSGYSDDGWCSADVAEVADPDRAAPP